MPRDNDKNNDSPRGRRDRPAGSWRTKAVPARRGGRKRSSPSAALPARAKVAASGGPMPQSRTAPSHMTRSLMPASAMAMPVRHAAISAMRPPRFNREDRPAGDRPDRASQGIRSRPDRDGEKRAFKPRGDRPRREDRDGEKRPLRRAATVRTTTATIGRLDATATTPVRPRVSRTRNLATRNPILRATVVMARSDPIPHGKVAARSGRTRRAAKVSKDGDRPQGDRPYSARPSRDGDRPERNSAATRNFLARCAGSRPAQGFRQPSGSRWRSG